MLFHDDETSLRLEVASYEFPMDGSNPDSEDGNWLLIRAAYTDEDGMVIRDSNACLRTDRKSVV